MLKDAQGLNVTTDSKQAIAAIDAHAKQCLCYSDRAESSILQAVAADPTCILANAHAAAYYLAQENAVSHQQAIPYLLDAKNHIAQATERERLYVLATEAWAKGKIDRAIAYCEELVVRFPYDILAVQRAQYHYFYMGNKIGLMCIAGNALAADPSNHYLMGMLAFGLEQCDRLSEAERIARFAVDMNRYDPWAHHAVAHVMETQGRYEEGIVWMENLADVWEDCNSMLYTHNWWHVALFYLAKGDSAKVLSLYDDRIWGRAQKSSPKDQVGAISLLLRLELQGIDVGKRWQELSAYLSPRIHEHALPFQDLHYVYALTRANHLDLTKEMILSMEAHALTVEPCLQKAWQEVALPVAKGAIAYALHDWKKSVKELKPVLSRLHEVGGSKAQRGLFEQIYADANKQAMLESGRYFYPRHAQAIAS
ncbi:tetratricopeptide repeat protein [Tumidithrix elongata RA019]|uniref:Tetratricopeptide repeat protein 38 n=1 Tax=Tumidithrix elongata BACA0141 TaxID=2716417 RepID=A0AAW9PZM0_9CYAN|nr:tetratricopeptide repeat protein [Tumidithrix elongata RA019]